MSLLDMVGEAARLKPEIRLAQAISEYSAALPEAQRVRFKNMHRRTPPSPGDIIGITEEINRDGTRMHRGWRQFGTRLVGILDRVQIFAKVGDLLVGGSQNMIASGVWAVFRLSLQVATGFLSFFDTVSEFFMRVARSTCLQEELVLLFPHCRELQHLMCEYVIVLVQACHQITSLTRRGGLSIFAGSLAMSFDKEFNKFERDLDKWADLIARRVTLLSTKAQLKSQGMALMSSAQSARVAEENLQRQLLQLLSPQQADYDFVWRHERKKGTVNWIFNADGFKSWSAADLSSVLWITGKIGSGKSVLMANIVGHLHTPSGNSPASPANQAAPSVEHRPCVASFFCHRSYANSLTGRHMLGSIANQITRSLLLSAQVDLAAKILGYPLNALSTADPDDITTFLLHIMPKDQAYHVVLDALDECDGHQIDETLRCLSRLTKDRHVRLCCSSRTGATARSSAMEHFEIEYSISMSAAGQASEMVDYIEAEIARRNRSAKLDAELCGIIQTTLASQADGMYLWVALQLEALFPRYGRRIMSDADIFKTLSSLPRTLSEAFNWALERVSDDRYGSTIFELVAVSARPLTVEELRVALNVQPGDVNWNPATLAHDTILIVGLCGGGLLEIEEENDTVHFIHLSALQHLVDLTSTDARSSIFHVDPAAADIKMGCICVTYLNYPHFETKLTTTQTVMVDVGGIAQKISDSLFSPSSPAGRLMATVVRNVSQPSQPLDVNVGRVLQDYLRSKQRQTYDDIHHLLKYAQEHWLHHTKRLYTQVDSTYHGLFRRLAFGNVGHITRPWATDGDDSHSQLRTATDWALAAGHASLFQILMERYCDDTFAPTAISDTLWPFVDKKPSRFALRDRDLGPIVAQVLRHGYHGEAEGLVRFLLEKGADPNLGYPPSEPSMTPLALALTHTLSCQNGSLARQSSPSPADTAKVILHLVKAGANCNVTVAGSTPLLMAIDAELPIECFIAMFHRNHPVDPEELIRMLRAGVKGRSVPVVNFLLGHGAADPDTCITEGSEEKIIQYAANTKCPAMVMCLAEHGATASFGTAVPEKEPLLQLVLQSQYEAATRILSIPKVRPTISKTTLGALLLAAVDCHISRSAIEDLVAILLKLGVDVDYATPDGHTALESAISKNKPTLILMLLSAGAKHDLYFGKTRAPALSLACRRRYPMVVIQLLAVGSDPNAVCLEGYAPVHHTIFARDPEILRLLLDAGADPDQATPQGIRPLHQAIDQASPILVSHLLEHGARAHVPSLTTSQDKNMNPLWRVCHYLQDAPQGDQKEALCTILSLLLEHITNVSGMEEIFSRCSHSLDESLYLAFMARGLDLKAACFLDNPETHPLVVTVRGSMFDAAQVAAEQSPQIIKDYALWMAVLHVAGDRCTDFVDILLFCGASPNATNPPWVSLRVGSNATTNLLVAALARSSDDVARTLFCSGAEVDILAPAEASNALLAAANFGRSVTFRSIWEQYVSGTAHESALRMRVPEVLGPMGELSCEEQLAQWESVAAIAPSDEYFEGRQLIFAFVESGFEIPGVKTS